MTHKEIKYTYCMGKMHHYPDDQTYSYNGILKKIKRVKEEVINAIIAAQNDNQIDLINDILFNTNPIDIIKLEVTYDENNEPLWEEMVDVTAINFLIEINRKIAELKK